MKAEFDIQDGVLLLYPTRTDVWRKNAHPIADTVLKLAETLARFQRVVLGVAPELVDEIKHKSPDKAELIPMLYNDIWARDSGAVACGDKLVKFGFNAWGGEDGLYGDWSLDSTLPEQMSRLLGRRLESADLIIEGGNIATNGKGVIIAIKDTVCNVNRNPNIGAPLAEDILKNSLNAEKLIWLPRGLKYDETGGHIDNLAAFADERTVLMPWTDDEGDPQYPIVKEAYEILSAATDTEGKPFEIVKLPMPSAFERSEADCEGITQEDKTKERPVGEIVQPSYLNFIFANGAVIVPSFDDPRDADAFAVFKDVFKDRTVIQFPSREIVLGGGGLHCITKNF